MPARSANYTLAQAMASLIHNEAKFVSNLDETNRRFARIEKDLEQVKAILLRHEEVLQNLTEAIREKIGLQTH